MENEVQTIKIDEEGRYMLFVKYPDKTHLPEIRNGTEILRDMIRLWWQGKEKFLLVPFVGDVEIRLERMEEASK